MWIGNGIKNNLLKLKKNRKKTEKEKYLKLENRVENLLKIYPCLFFQEHIQYTLIGGNKNAFVQTYMLGCKYYLFNVRIYPNIKNETILKIGKQANLFFSEFFNYLKSKGVVDQNSILFKYEDNILYFAKIPINIYEKIDVYKKELDKYIRMYQICKKEFMKYEQDMSSFHFDIIPNDISDSIGYGFIGKIINNKTRQKDIEFSTKYTLGLIKRIINLSEKNNYSLYNSHIDGGICCEKSNVFYVNEIETYLFGKLIVSTDKFICFSDKKIDNLIKQAKKFENFVDNLLQKHEITNYYFYYTNKVRIFTYNSWILDCEIDWSCEKLKEEIEKQIKESATKENTFSNGIIC